MEVGHIVGYCEKCKKSIWSNEDYELVNNPHETIYGKVEKSIFHKKEC